MLRSHAISYLLLTIGLASLSSLAISTPSYAADTVTDQVNIEVPITCTLTGTGMNTHTATINPGTYNSNIGTTNMKVICNDTNGFGVYAIGYTDDTDGNNTLESTTLSPTQTIATGTAISGNSQWAMKLSTQTSPTPAYPITIMNSFDSFHTVPDDYTLVAKRTAATDVGESATGSNFSSTYQAFISSTQPADTYVGQVKYVLVHPHDAPAPEKPVVCNPEGTTIDTGESTDIICMQDMNATVADSMELEMPAVLKDSRDGKEYIIGKLADGYIWMWQNLDLDIDSDYEYDSTNTAVPSNWDVVLNSTHITSDTTWDTYNTASESYDPGDYCYDNENIGSDSMIPCSQPANMDHIGNYYNLAAAWALDNSDGHSGVVDQSICPSGGWMLPLSYYTQPFSFQYMLNEYGLSNYYMTDPYIWDLPLFFTPSGAWSGELNNFGTEGIYHSSIGISRLYFDIDGYVNPNTETPNGAGMPIRCAFYYN